MLMMGAREKLSRLGKSLENSPFEQPNHLFEAWRWEKHGPYEEEEDAAHFGPFSLCRLVLSLQQRRSTSRRPWMEAVEAVR